MIGCSCKADQSHGMACPVIRENRKPAAQYREEYRELLARAQASRDGGMSANVPYQLQKLGVPADLILALRNLRQTAALKAAKDFVSADRTIARVLLLASGVRGVGKSVAAAFVLGSHVKHYDWNAQPSGGKQRPPFMWASASEVTQETDFGRVNPEWLDNLKACRLLVLDDVGKEGGTAPGLAALRDVMVQRMEKHRPTVVTSNEGPEEMQRRYGPSWLDRLAAVTLMPDLSREKPLRTKGKP